MNKHLITKLADDVWSIAKTLEEAGDIKLCDKLKTISGCLHDIRTDSDTDWYLRRDIEDE
jgi:hypothetical protein